MKSLVGVFLAFFITFGAAGYSVGRHFALSETYLLISIADKTTLQVKNNVLYLEYLGQEHQPYWSINLNSQESMFSNSQAILDSMKGKSLTAESDLLLTFLAGGAATTTAVDVYKSVKEVNSKSDFRRKVAMIVGGVSGYLAGYYLGIHSVKDTDPEVASALRKPESIEKIKKYVFLSIWKNRGFSFDDSQYSKPVDKPKVECKDDQRVDCVLLEMEQSGIFERNNIKGKLIAEAQKRLSNDSENLKGYEFAVFLF